MTDIRYEDTTTYWFMFWNFSCGLWNWMCAWLSQALLCKFQSQMSDWPNTNCWFDLRTLVAEGRTDRGCLYMKMLGKLLWFVKMHSTKDRDLGACVIWGLSQQGQTGTFWEKTISFQKIQNRWKVLFLTAESRPLLSPVPFSWAEYEYRDPSSSADDEDSWLIHYYKSVGLSS